ncbi:hypothetical protein C8F01DRAFT_991648 [Mycena amicta]|nr:hypothetical protein C8F01DRAFT_991648 [Mycena amicta]
MLSTRITISSTSTTSRASGTTVTHLHAHGERPSVLMRVHFALMSLGAWEGCAVAFVLGCGIGVLLRMFWVLTVLSVRALRSTGTSSSTVDYYYAELEVEAEADAEEIFIAPRMYTVPVVVDEAGYPVEKPAESK